MGQITIAAMTALLICVFLGGRFIGYLRAREFGQQIRADGPQGHLLKAGTPTMGGLLIFASVAIPFLVLSGRAVEGLVVFAVALASAAIGFLDDFLKAVRRRSLGLKGRWKLLGQAILSLGLWWVARRHLGLSPALVVPPWDLRLELGPVLSLGLVFLVLAGASNAVNLSDGLDGLAAGSSAIVLLAYTAMAASSGRTDLAVLCGSLVGTCVGFLWFNSFPASVFMGDTGSLGLGGAIGAMAVVTETELLLVLIGGLFVIEALSVAVQVIGYRTTGRRVLLMAPLHHHFELLGWSETKIILRLWILAAVCAGIGFTLFQQSLGH